MRIVFRHTKFYSYEPVPPGVKVTSNDVASGRAIPGAIDGQWRMRVERECPKGADFTTVHLSEHHVVQKVLEEKLRRGTTVSRRQAVALFLAEYVLPGHAHRSWVTGVEVHDEGGADEALMRVELKRHVDSSNLDASEVEAHVAAYLELASAADHAAHICAHLRVKGTK